MSSLNSVTLIGNLARDPEIRSLQDGRRVANITVVTSERWTDKASGEKKDKPEFHRVTVWNDRIVDVVERFCTKGKKVAIHNAMLETRKWTDQNGQDKYTTEVIVKAFRGELVLLGGRQDSDADAPSQSSGQAYGSHRGGGQRPGPEAAYRAPAKPDAGGDDLDDEIPFHHTSLCIIHESHHGCKRGDC